MYFLKSLFRAGCVLLLGVFLYSTLPAGAAPAVLDETHAAIQAVMAVQGEVTAEWLKTPEILGTAVGLDDSGSPALVVYVDRESTRMADVVRSLPPKVRGIGVKVEPTDKFRAFAKGGHHGGPGAGGGGGSGVSHTATQTPPIQLGTSGGWRNDLANGYCCGGTLGSLIQVNGVLYVMSNYHVLESDIVAGGNGLIATTGDGAIQPGLIDVGCNANNAQIVASLVKLGSLPGSNVDVGIAQVVGGMVRTDGAILEIGTLSAQTVGASLNQTVKKSGRTTGLSHSYINGLNATISVSYENECAGGTAFTKTFTGQVVISNPQSSFLNSGDSGSLMVEDVATSPRAVGLLYAGSSTAAIANPIGQVLQFVGSKLGGTATMVGF